MDRQAGAAPAMDMMAGAAAAAVDSRVGALAGDSRIVGALEHPLHRCGARIVSR
jgi:hypothetical protein